MIQQKIKKQVKSSSNPFMDMSCSFNALLGIVTVPSSLIFSLFSTFRSKLLCLFVKFCYKLVIFRLSHYFKKSIISYFLSQIAIIDNIYLIQELNFRILMIIIIITLILFWYIFNNKSQFLILLNSREQFSGAFAHLGLPLLQRESRKHFKET